MLYDKFKYTNIYKINLCKNILINIINIFQYY